MRCCDVQHGSTEPQTYTTIQHRPPPRYDNTNDRSKFIHQMTNQQFALGCVPGARPSDLGLMERVPRAGNRAGGGGQRGGGEQRRRG